MLQNVGIEPTPSEKHPDVHRELIVHSERAETSIHRKAGLTMWVELKTPAVDAVTVLIGRAEIRP